jgi:hypothetical protein
LQDIPVALAIKLKVGILISVSLKPLSRSFISVEILQTHATALQTLSIELKFGASKNNQCGSHYPKSTFHLILGK